MKVYRHLLYGFFFFLPTFLVAQQDTTSHTIFSVSDTVFAKKLFDESVLLMQKQKPVEALQKLDSAEVIYTQLFGEKDFKLSRVWNLRGLLYDQQNKLDNANASYLMAVSIIKGTLGENNRDIGVLYNNRF